MPSGRRAAVVFAVAVIAVFVVDFSPSYGSDSTTNQPPTLDPISDQHAYELTLITFTASATGNGTLTFSLEDVPPAGSSINSTTGVFSWTPAEDQDGIHQVTVRVSDGSGRTDSQAVTINVIEVGSPPTLAEIPFQITDRLTRLTFTATAADPDRPANTLTFSLDGATPEGASINSTTGIFSWTPSRNQSGYYPVTVAVEDGTGYLIRQTVDIVVRHPDALDITEDVRSAKYTPHRCWTQEAKTAYIHAHPHYNDDLILAIFSGPPPAAYKNIGDSVCRPDCPTLGIRLVRAGDEVNINVNADTNYGAESAVTYTMRGEPNGASLTTTDGIGEFSWDTPSDYRGGQLITFTANDSGYTCTAYSSIWVYAPPPPPNDKPVVDVSGPLTTFTYAVAAAYDWLEIEEDPPNFVFKYTGIYEDFEDVKYWITAVDKNHNDPLTLSVSRAPDVSYAALADCDTLDKPTVTLHLEGAEIKSGKSDISTAVCLVALEDTDGEETFQVRLDDGETSAYDEGVYSIINVLRVVFEAAIDPPTPDDVMPSPSPPTPVDDLGKLSRLGLSIGIGTVHDYEDQIQADKVRLWRCHHQYHLEDLDCKSGPIGDVDTFLDSLINSVIAHLESFLRQSPGPIDAMPNPAPGWTILANIGETETVVHHDVVLVTNSSETTAKSSYTRESVGNSTSGMDVTLQDYGVEQGQTYTYGAYIFVNGSDGIYIPLTTVTIPDITPPVLTLLGPANITIPLGPAYAEPGYTATDNIDGDITWNVTVTGTVDTITAGTYHLYYDVSDGSGNPAIQQNRTVNVVEYYPYISMSGGPYQTILQGSGPYTDPGATCIDDTDAARPVNSTGGTVDTNTVGIYRLTYECTDSDGNDSYVATRTVTVQDAPPVITLNGPAELTVPLNSTYADPGASCIDLTDGALQATAGGDTVDATSAGSYRTTYTCTDSHGHAVNTTRTVTVAAYIIPPSITLIGPSPDTVGQLLTYDDPGALCTDDIDPVRTVYAGSYPDTNIPGNYTLTYTCTDSGGSVAMPAHRTLVVEDLPPEIYVWGENPVVLAVGANFTDSGAGCGDLTDRILNANVTATGEVDTSIAGAYAITYTCTDSHGHRAEATRTVLVGQPPTGQSPFIVLNGPASATIMQGFPYIDPGALCTDDIDPVRTIYAARADTSASGSQTLTYACTDSDGNAAIPANRTLVVEDSPPYIYMQGPSHIVLSVGANFTDPGADCYDRTDTYIRTMAGGDAVDTSTVGAYTIIYSCTDSGGLRAVPITRTVLVTSPPGSVPVLALNGSFAETIPQGTTFDDPGALCTDDIDPVRTVYASQPDTSASGSQTLTYTCTDSNGNAAIPVIRILVVLDAPPVITLNGSTAITLAAGSIFSDPGATCIDLTDGTLPVVTAGDAVDTDTAGAYTISYTCVDGHGHRAEATRTVDVTAPANRPPVADAGPDRQARPGTVVTLDGTGSSDPDKDIISYVWSQTSGNTVKLSNVTASSIQFTAPAGPAILIFQLNVTDGSLSSTDIVAVNVTANRPPTASAGPDQTAHEGDTITLNGTASDPDGDPLTYLWTHDSDLFISIYDATAPSIQFTAPQVSSDTAISFTLTVTDRHNATVSDQVTVTVRDIPESTSDFVTTWRTAAPNESITIPVGGATGTYTVRWGDNTTSTAAGDQTHVYTATGDHTIRISGDLTRLHLGGDPANAAKLVSIDQWGDVQWTTMREAFAWATNMAYRATDTPDLSRVTDMSLMFTGTYRFNGDLSSWDLSRVANAAFMFFDAFSFDQDISSWDVSSATNMTDMFNGALSFERNLGGWYIMPTGTTINSDDAPGVVAGISAQNTFLDRQNPVYGIGTGGDSASFSMNGTNLVLDAVPTKRTYVVNITSTGDFGTNNHRIFDISVTGLSSNSPPVADAGDHQSVQSGDTITLDGTGSSDPDTGDALSYVWSQTSGTTVTLSNSTVPSPTFTAPAGPAVLVFELSVTDTGSLSSIDTVNVTVAAPPNRMPVADAGPDQAVYSGAAVTLDGTGSSDPDSGDSILYSWSQTSGDTVTLSNSTISSPTFTAPTGPAILIFELSVTDTGSLSSIDTINVTVAAPANRMPVADAGDDQAVASGAAVTLDGTGSSDPDSGDSILYSWSQTSGDTVTLSNSTISSPTFTAPTGPAILIFELSVTDTGSLSSIDTINVTVAAPANRMPVADAGPDQAVASGAAVTLDGTGSSDPDSGDSILYSWSQTSGDTVTLSNSTISSPTFTAPTGPAILIFELSVTDTGSLSSIDTINVTVAAPANRMPVADAGPDQAVASGAAVTLDGTGSSDPDSGDSILYSWSQTSGDTVTLSNSTISSPTFTAPTGPAVLVFLLNVTDGSLFSTDTVSVNVTAPPNIPPVLGQIGNWTVNEGSNLSFVVTAADGNPGDTVTYSVSGAQPGAVFNPATGEFSWTPAESQGPGSYTVTFGATDGLDAAEPRTTTITVNEVNQAPLFERSVREGYRCNAAVNSTVTLDFAVTDPDLPAQTLAVDDTSAGDIAYSAEVVDGTLRFSAAIAETDEQQFPDDHRLLFYIVVADGHDPPGTDNMLIRIYLPAAGEPDWPDC